LTTFASVIYDVTIVMVTSAFPDVLPKAPAAPISEEWRLSIRLAVAQWLRSARAVRDAQDSLFASGLSTDEALRRRRAQSTDPGLSDVLRLAVTIVITSGRLETADRRRLRGPHRDALIAAIVAATADAYAFVLRAETRSDQERLTDFNLDVGDY
jgi:hypothetical protein